MLIAQISDLHIGLPGRLAYGCIDTAARFSRCCEHILRLRPRPDVIVASGDLVDAGDPAEYDRLHGLLAGLPMPLYVMPGNHDRHAALRAAFADHGHIPCAGDRLRYTIEAGALRLIMLDTVIPGAEGGALGQEQLLWLEQALEAQPTKPALIFMHHPPMAVGIRGMDAIALNADDAARLGTLVARHPRVERIACGHLHRTVEARWNGTVVGVCPSAAFQSMPGLREGFVAAPGEPPAYQLHWWDGGRLITHTVQVVAE